MFFLVWRKGKAKNSFWTSHIIFQGSWGNLFFSFVEQNRYCHMIFIVYGFEWGQGCKSIASFQKLRKSTMSFRHTEIKVNQPTFRPSGANWLSISAKTLTCSGYLPSSSSQHLLRQGKTTNQTPRLVSAKRNSLVGLVVEIVSLKQKSGAFTVSIRHD